MNDCCPSPDFPVVDPANNPEVMNTRKRLRWLFHGQVVLILCKLWIFGFLKAIF